MHANAATALEEYAKPGAKVLDVGCGSGYLTAVNPHPPVKRNKLMKIGFSKNGTTGGESRGD